MPTTNTAKEILVENEKRVIRILPWSYTSLTGFETCARKHYSERLSKEFERPFNKTASDGDLWHKQAEDYAKEGTPIPDSNPHGAKMIAILDELRSKGTGEFFAERELAVRIDRTPCGWRDKDCYSRAKLDILYLEPEEATIIDWKTGKPDVFSTQLKMNALLLLMHYPNLKRVDYRYEWLKGDHPATKGTVYREFLDEEWAKFVKRFGKYQKAFDKNDWPAKSGGLCKQYCGVVTCENYGKSKR